MKMGEPPKKQPKEVLVYIHWNIVTNLKTLRTNMNLETSNGVGTAKDETTNTGRGKDHLEIALGPARGLEIETIGNASANAIDKNRRKDREKEEEKERGRKTEKDPEKKTGTEIETGRDNSDSGRDSESANDRDHEIG